VCQDDRIRERELPSKPLPEEQDDRIRERELPSKPLPEDVYPEYEGPSRPKAMLEIQTLQGTAAERTRKGKDVIASTLGPVPPDTQDVVGEYLRQSARGKFVDKPTGEREIVPIEFGGGMAGELRPDAALRIGKKRLSKRLEQRALPIDLTEYEIVETPVVGESVIETREVYTVPLPGYEDIQFQSKEKAEEAIKKYEETQQQRLMGVYGKREQLKATADLPYATFGFGTITPTIEYKPTKIITGDALEFGVVSDPLKGYQPPPGYKIAGTGPQIYKQQQVQLYEQMPDMDKIDVYSRYGEGLKDIPLAGGILYNILTEPFAKEEEQIVREAEFQRQRALLKDPSPAKRKKIDVEYEKAIKKVTESRLDIKPDLSYRYSPGYGKGDLLEPVTRPFQEIGGRVWAGDIPLVDIEMGLATKKKISAAATLASFGVPAFKAAKLLKAGLTGTTAYVPPRVGLGVTTLSTSKTLTAAGKGLLARTATVTGTTPAIGIAAGTGFSQYLIFAGGSRKATELTGSPGVGYLIGGGLAAGAGRISQSLQSRLFPLKQAKTAVVGVRGTGVIDKKGTSTISDTAVMQRWRNILGYEKRIVGTARGFTKTVERPQGVSIGKQTYVRKPLPVETGMLARPDVTIQLPRFTAGRGVSVGLDRPVYRQDYIGTAFIREVGKTTQPKLFGGVARMEIGARQTIGRSLQWVKIGQGTYLKDLPGKGDPAYWTKNFMKTYKSYTKKIDSFKKYTLGDKEFTKDAYVRTYRYVPKREGIGFGQKLAVFKARGEGAFYKFKELPKEKVPISYVMGKQYTKPTEKLIFGTERGTINIGGKKIDYQETFMEGIKKLDKDVGRGLGGKVSIQMGGKQTGGQALIRTQDIKIPEGIQSSALNIGLLSRATEGISYSFREMPTKLVPPLQTQKLEPPKTKTHTILLGTISTFGGL
jgi:hypothetical protein